MIIKRLTLLVLVACVALSPHAKAQAVVDLGSAASFAILAGAGITFTGAVSSTTITGDIGTFPTTTITGLGGIVLNGTNHGGDATTQAAKTGVSAAYNDAAGRTATTTYGPIFDLGGLTLTPGVYNDPSSFTITGTLTLNAQGNPNAVFIFQAGSTLTTAASSQIVLTNGARAENVFWQVGSAVTFGTSSVFAGNVIASASVAVGSGTTLNGSVFSLGGAVTLDGNNSISAIPEPATSAFMAAAGALGVAVWRRRRALGRT